MTKEYKRILAKKKSAGLTWDAFISWVNFVRNKIT